MSSSPPPSEPQSEPPPPPPEPQTQPETEPTENPKPPIIQALSYSPLKKPQPIPWSHEETLNLIKAYQEKWYSLKRGQLKASQWEEVAITVAARCGLDEPSKSGTQCRHKIEKLRKRYRSEKQKLPPSSSSSSFNYHNTHPWIYFSLMDHLERGPLPISAVAPHHHQLPLLNNQDTPLTNNNDYDDNDDVDVDHSDDERRDLRFASLRNLRPPTTATPPSHHHHHHHSANTSYHSSSADGFFRIASHFGNGFVKGSDFQAAKKRKKSYLEQENVIGGDDDTNTNNGGGVDDTGARSCDLVAELGAQIREFADKFVNIEKKKLEMIRETELLRNEMENKRMEMILVSQQKTVELITNAFDLASSALSQNNTINMKMKMKMNNSNATNPDL